MSHIGERIREIRGGMQQGEMAAKLGIHKNTLKNYEKGERIPDASIMLKILDHFPGSDPAWLLTGGLQGETSDSSTEG
jgi:transcriptional regulator with XRE-family HTH domain